MIRKKVLIFGASGQIGKYCIRRLVRNNFRVIAATRNTHQKGYILKTQAPIGFIDIREVDLNDIDKIRKLIDESDICLNLIGILFEKGKKNTFKKIHTDFPEKISKICKEENKFFIHVSALALSSVKDSKYALSKIEGEGSKQRIVPLGSKVLVNLEKYLELRNQFKNIKNNNLFISKSYKKLDRTAVFRIIKSTGVKVGINTSIYPHILRHSAATHMLEGGCDLRTVQEFLGHSSVSTTQIYTKVTKAFLEEAFIESHPRS